MDQRSVLESRNAPTAALKSTILILDDEPLVRSMLESVLTKHGYVVLSASRAQDAIELYFHRHQEIDLLITDITMPGMDGVNMVDQIRSLFPDVRVLFISGRADTLPEWASETCGFLMKPFRGPKLCEAVGALLAR